MDTMSDTFTSDALHAVTCEYEALGVRNKILEAAYEKLLVAYIELKRESKTNRSQVCLPN